MTHEGQDRWEVIGDCLGVRRNDGSILVPTADEIFSIALEGGQSELLPDLDPSSALKGLTFSRFPALLELRVESTPEEIRWVTVAVGEDTESPVQDIRALKGDHIVIRNCWYPLIKENIAELEEILGLVGLEKPGKLTLRQYLTLKAKSSRSTTVKDCVEDASLATKPLSGKDVSLPDSFCGRLYPYQEEGFQWLSLISDEGIGAILGDEMGLGKTVQIIALFASENSKGDLSSLVVAPGTLLENWRREIGKFAPKLVTRIHQGSERTGFPSELRAADVVITSYDTLARDLPMFRQIKWNIVVLDEAQAIKNPDTRRARTVKRLPRRVSIAVTGTPVENRLSDLWSIMDYVIPGYLGDLSSFLGNFSDDRPGALALEPFISPLMLRRRVLEVAGDLPPRIDIPQILALDPASAADYENLRKEIVAEYGDQATLVALGKLRMFCTHPFVLSSQKGDPVAASPKYARLVEILEEIFDNGQKTIIFTSYTVMADLLVSDIRERFGVFTAFIDGRVQIGDRQGVVDRFSEIKGAAVLVLNPRAAGTGLNVTAANHVIHYNLEWNPALEDQASARAYRRGQTLPVTVHRLFYAETVEDVINSRLTRKRDLASAAVVGHEGREEDLTDIFSAIRVSPLAKGSNS